MRFSYDTASNPSAPVAGITLIGPTGRASDEIGSIDTGADITAAPPGLIGRLGLRAVDRVIIRNVSGGMTDTDVYSAKVVMSNTSFGFIGMASLPCDRVIIGRNLINLWRMVLDGGSETCEIAA